MKIGAIIQARQGSSRLPNKATIDICGKPALQRVIERVRACKKLDYIIVATTENKQDDAIKEICQENGVNCFRGSEENVLDRVLKAAQKFDIDVVVEITADCPLIDWNHINTLIDMHLNNDCDMTTNILTRQFPRGFDIRIFNKEALERVEKEVDNDIDRQHVSTWMYLNPKGKVNYKVQNWDAPCEQFRPDLEFTLDTPEDLELIRWIYSFEKQGYNLALTCQEVINLINIYPSVYEKVSKIQRKDYFQELEEAYKQPKAERSENEKECSDNRSRGTGKRGRPAKKRKNN